MRSKKGTLPCNADVKQYVRRVSHVLKTRTRCRNHILAGVALITVSSQPCSCDRHGEQSAAAVRASRAQSIHGTDLASVACREYLRDGACRHFDDTVRNPTSHNVSSNGTRLRILLPLKREMQ